MIDGISLFNWLSFNGGDELKDYMKDMYEAVFFYGNKVLKLDKPLDTAWFNAYKDVCEA